MKSTEQQLEQRGFLPNNFQTGQCNLTITEKLELLKSKVPTDRTLAARLLKDGLKPEYAIAGMIRALIAEKKLYPKIEISETLALCGEPAVKPLLEQLGEIGSNQHKKVPGKKFGKQNYPLPRDIAARILARTGKSALPGLLKFIETANERQLSEAIDAIGFICFYDKKKGVFDKLKNCYQSHKKNDLIKWKILRACSSFPESISFLKSEEQKLTNPELLNEINRSIELAGKR